MTNNHKIPYDDQTIEIMAGFLKAMSDPNRLKILLLLSVSQELNVISIAQTLNMTHSAVSHQLNMLKRMRLLTSKREGKNVIYSLADDHIYSIINAAADHALEIL
ncbi:MAG TPA: helix-turn-helix transcriptional regulator [Clostridiales bacterium]|nr:helix-turn-helix transcriptional regulator [Clostridiales bacterium]